MVNDYVTKDIRLITGRGRKFVTPFMQYQSKSNEKYVKISNILLESLILGRSEKTSHSEGWEGDNDFVTTVLKY